jgi:hypothetical protein
LVAVKNAQWEAGMEALEKKNARKTAALERTEVLTPLDEA